jgi:hypothetical protein
MNRTRIFLSSTCFDLAPVREALRDAFLKLGHEPVLSDYPSFPVDPDADCISNCQRNVREHSDILVLIVGGRRGFLDPHSGKSVTNCEYDVARASGLPVFTFVLRSVSQLRHIWKKNPEADFSPVVDYPDVFRFLERIYESNRWVYTFEKTVEIAQVLEIQLSSLFRDLLKRSRLGTLDPYGAFLPLSRRAEQIAREKPDYWEFMLTAELLAVRMAEVRSQLDRIQGGRKHIQVKPVNLEQLFDLISANFTDLANWSQACTAHFKRIEASWGEPGQAGDPLEIKRSVEEFVETCEHLVRWEEHVRSIAPPDGFETLIKTLSGLGEATFQQLESFPVRLVAPFENGAKPTGSIHLNMTLECPPMDAFNAELARLKGVLGMSS